MTRKTKPSSGIRSARPGHIRSGLQPDMPGTEQEPGQGARRAEATLETMRKVFTLPESDQSTLARLDREISENLLGFLRDRIVAGDIAPANLEKGFLATAIPDDPMFVSDQVDFLLRNVVAQSVHTASPSFVGHMTSALPYFMLPLAKIMVALNQNLVKIETSKAFTPLERQVVGMLHRLVYNAPEAFYDEWTQSSTHSLGVFTSGGTIANITALWVARNRLLPAVEGRFAGVQEDGLAAGLMTHGYKNLAVLVSRRGHYSLRKATDVLGLGRRNLVAIPVDSHHRIDCQALEQTIWQLRAAGTGIAAIVGVAGTTETGSVDPLADMAAIAARENIFFHVDAAWGGPTLFSEKYRHLLRGIELADSVTIDAHKQLYVPMGAGIVVFRSEKSLTEVEHHARYIIRQGSRDIGKHTLEGSRPGMAMLVHSALRIIGRRGFELLIDLGIGKAAQFARTISAQPDFEVISEPELNLLTYRYVPHAARQLLEHGDPDIVRQCNEILNSLNESLQKTQRARGKTFVSRTSFEVKSYQDQVISVLRVVLANPLTTRQILADILEEQHSCGEDLLTTEGFASRFAELAGQLPVTAQKELTL